MTAKRSQRITRGHSGDAMARAVAVTEHGSGAGPARWVGRGPAAAPASPPRPFGGAPAGPGEGIVPIYPKTPGGAFGAAAKNLQTFRRETEHRHSGTEGRRGSGVAASKPPVFGAGAHPRHIGTVRRGHRAGTGPLPALA